MATIFGTHQHSLTGARYQFKAEYSADGPTDIHWALWFNQDGCDPRHALGVIRDADRIALPLRAVIDEVVRVINGS